MAEHIDQAEQLRRLHELYAEMSDGQLRVMAAGMNGLTEVAQQTLRAEFSRRGLAIPPEGATAHLLTREEDELVDCYLASDSFGARLVMNILASAGIPSCLFGEFGENVQRLLKTHDTGGTVRVTASDAKRAREIIGLYFPGESEDDTEFDACCPKCHSAEVIFQGLEPLPSPAIPGACKISWSCGDCGYQWEEGGEGA